MRIFFLLLSLSFVAPCFAGDDYKWGADSEYHEGVPKGKVEKQPQWTSTVFPGTVRDWWIYVPAQYDLNTPAAYMVFQDGGGPVNEKGEMRAPVVFDNLIHKKEMPVTIGVFINPGVLPAAEPTDLGDGKKKAPRQNRSFEYDSLGDRYVRFLTEEIIPQVEKKYKLSTDPALHAICGQSSGGSCAFTAAWERPDVFSKVVSGIGSFTSLHGANAFPDLIRKTEPKPIRVFLQDGNQDLDIYGGSWWHANQDMAAALRWSGYDYKFLQGTLGHSGKQLGAAFPEVMRWLWRAEPVTSSRPEKVDPRGVFEVLVKGEEWKRKTNILGSGFSAAANDAGEVYFSDLGVQGQQAVIWKLDSDGKTTEFIRSEKPAVDLQFGADGKLYAGHQDYISNYDKDGKEAVVIDKFEGKCHAFALNYSGTIYAGFSEPEKLTIVKAGKRVDADIQKLAPNLKDFNPSYFIFTPDQGFLVMAEFDKSQLQSFRVEADGKLAHPEPFYSLQTLEGQDRFIALAAAVDDKGRIYVSSSNGIQILDQGGRVIGILTLPERNIVKGMCFGGANFDTLFAVTEKAVYTRKLNAKGVRSCKPPIAVPPPRM